MRPRFAIVVALCGLSAVACVPRDTPAVASPAIVAQQPAVEPVGPPASRRTDAQVAKAMEQLAGYCGALQAYVIGAQLFGSEKRRATIGKAARVLDRLCADPPRDVASAVEIAAQALAELQAKPARR